MKSLRVTLAFLALLVATFAGAFAQTLPFKQIPLNVADGTGQGEALSPSINSIGWLPFGPTPFQYYVFQNGALIGKVGTTPFNVVQQGLTPATTYGYDVYSDNGSNQLTYGGHFTTTTLPASPLLFQTTFEEDAPGGTSTIGGWDKSGNNPADLTIDTSVVRAGTKSVRFNFQFADWTDTGDGHRLQIAQANSISTNRNWRTLAVLGTVIWVGISTYIDPSWQPDFTNNGELIWQWHGTTTGPGLLNPPMALYFHGSTGSVTLNSTNDTYACSAGDGPHSNQLYNFDLSTVKGRWVDWVMKVNFNYTGGSWDVWMDGVHVVSFTGNTIYHCDNQTTELGPFFDFGPYKWDWGNLPTQVTSRIMNADEVRFGGPTATCNDVKPTGAPACQPFNRRRRRRRATTRYAWRRSHDRARRVASA